MTPSPWLYSFIKSFEKLRLTAYLPTPNDVWTIGWGHTKGVKEGDSCTPEEAEAFLHADVQGAVEKVCNTAHVLLTQNQFDALVSLTFNIGTGAFSTSMLLRKLNASDYVGASAEFMCWDKQRGVVLNGLERRREAERVHFDTP